MRTLRHRAIQVGSSIHMEDQKFASFSIISSFCVPYISATAKIEPYKQRTYFFHRPCTPCRNPVKPVPVKKLCRMRMAGLCQFYWHTCYIFVYHVTNKICCCVQNFMKIRWFFTAIWRYIKMAIFKMATVRHLGIVCFTTIRDHPRSHCCWPQLPVKFHVNLMHRSEDMAIWIFRIVGLKCLFRPPKWWFGGLWTHKCDYSSSRPQKAHP